MIAAFNLDDGVAARESSGYPQRAHGSFGPGRHEAQQLQRRHSHLYAARQLRFEPGGCAKARAPHGGLLQRLNDARMGVAGDERPVGHDIVHVAIAVGVKQIRPGAALYEARRASNGFESAHGAAHSAGQHLLCLGEQALGGLDALWAGGRTRLGIITACWHTSTCIWTWSADRWPLG